MTDKQEENLQEDRSPEQQILFSAQSMEDVAFFFDSFTETQKSKTCLCFDIKVEGLLDTESILEASRWLSSHSAIFVPSVPLEPSALLLIDKMGPRAISLKLLYDGLGDAEVKFGLLGALLDRLSTPIWIIEKGLSPALREKIQDLPVEKIWDGV